jgi:hypothetical protein
MEAGPGQQLALILLDRATTAEIGETFQENGALRINILPAQVNFASRSFFASSPAGDNSW